jgi:hypothetical protein
MDVGTLNHRSDMLQYYLMPLVPKISGQTLLSMEHLARRSVFSLIIANSDKAHTSCGLLSYLQVRRHVDSQQALA